MYEPLDALPLWGLFAGIVVVILLAIEGGYRLGRWRRQHTDQEKEAPVGTAVAAALALLAFLMAFTFGSAATRHEARRGILLDEVNAIRTTYLRTGFLPEPHRTTIRRLLREYVDIRLAAVEDGDLKGGIERSEELHGRLWSQVVAVAEKDPHSITIGLFIQSVNELIDLHAKRVSAVRRSRIPVTIWGALFAVSLLSLGTMGYHSGLSRTRRSPASLAVVVSFAVTIWLIADLDRPQEGLIRVSQQPMIDLRNSIAEPGG